MLDYFLKTPLSPDFIKHGFWPNVSKRLKQQQPELISVSILVKVDWTLFSDWDLSPVQNQHAGRWTCNHDWKQLLNASPASVVFVVPSWGFNSGAATVCGWASCKDCSWTTIQTESCQSSSDWQVSQWDTALVVRIRPWRSERMETVHPVIWGMPTTLLLDSWMYLSFCSCERHFSTGKVNAHEQLLAPIMNWEWFHVWLKGPDVYLD